MFKAAQNGELDFLKQMLESHANDRSFLKGRDEDGHTITHWAGMLRFVNSLKSLTYSSNSPVRKEGSLRMADR